MDSVAKLVDVLYERFLLLDVFGKVVPGVIVLYAAVSTFWSVLAAQAWVDQLAPWGWAFVFGLSWSLAFAIQWFGQWLGLVPDFRDLGVWYERRAAFQRQAHEAELTQLSRLLVIKEACGNGCIAVAVSLAIMVLGQPSRSCAWMRADPWRAVLLVFILCGTIVCLRAMAVEQVDRAGRYLDAVLRDRAPRPPGDREP